MLELVDMYFTVMFIIIFTNYFTVSFSSICKGLIASSLFERTEYSSLLLSHVLAISARLTWLVYRVIVWQDRLSATAANAKASRQTGNITRPRVRALTLGFPVNITRTMRQAALRSMNGVIRMVTHS